MSSPQPYQLSSQEVEMDIDMDLTPPNSPSDNFPPPHPHSGICTFDPPPENWDEDTESQSETDSLYSGSSESDESSEPPNSPSRNFTPRHLPSMIGTYDPPPRFSDADTESQSETDSFYSGSSESDESSEPGSPEPEHDPYEFLQKPYRRRPTGSDAVEGLAYTLGPAPNRDPSCSICMELIESSQESVTHLYIDDHNDYSAMDKTQLAASCCHNAWHEECFMSWAREIVDREDDELITCPMCRGEMHDRVLFGPKRISELLNDLLDDFNGSAEEAEQIWLEASNLNQVPELTDSVSEDDDMDLDEMDGIEQWRGIGIIDRR